MKPMALVAASAAVNASLFLGIELLAFFGGHSRRAAAPPVVVAVYLAGSAAGEAEETTPAEPLAPPFAPDAVDAPPAPTLKERRTDTAMRLVDVVVADRAAPRARLDANALVAASLCSGRRERGCISVGALDGVPSVGGATETFGPREAAWR